jgi:hypothetical protein
MGAGRSLSRSRMDVRRGTGQSYLSRNLRRAVSSSACARVWFWEGDEEVDGMSLRWTIRSRKARRVEALSMAGSSNSRERGPEETAWAWRKTPLVSASGLSLADGAEMGKVWTHLAAKR